MLGEVARDGVAIIYAMLATYKKDNPHIT